MEKSAKTTAKKPAAKRAAKTAPKTAIKKAASKTAATKKATAKKAAAKKNPAKKTAAKRVSDPTLEIVKKCHKALDDKALAALITAALQGEDASAYAAEVASVTDALKSELAGELKAGLELRLSKKVRTGFRLCTKDGSGYIDCSDEELAEQLAPFFRELRI